MLDRKDTPAGAEQRPEAGAGSGMGLKAFNRTGREDTTTEVLRPRRDPNAVRRNGVLIAVVVAAVCVLFYMAFQRSGLSLIPSASPEDQHSFGAPGEHPVDKSE